jgi:hypothetical protein
MSKSLFETRYMRAWACAALLALTVSCTPDEETAVSPKKQASEEHLQFLENSGFDRKDIVLQDGIFIIDEDILISKEEVEGYIFQQRSLSQGREQHYRGTYLVSDSYVTNIKFYIDPTVPAAWATAVRGAITQWNNVNGTKLFMSEVSSSGQANTIINTGYSNQNWVARAYLPSYNRRPGHTMTINTKYNSLSSGYKLFTIVHEMGHIFGLYHTDQTQGVFISGTPTTDANSVMNSYVLPWNGFTAGDVSAVQIIYPG